MKMHDKMDTKGKFIDGHNFTVKNDCSNEKNNDSMCFHISVLILNIIKYLIKYAIILHYCLITHENPTVGVGLHFTFMYLTDTCINRD